MPTSFIPDAKPLRLAELLALSRTSVSLRLCAMIHAIAGRQGASLRARRVCPKPVELGWTYEPCEGVDPMPDYENVLTD